MRASRTDKFSSFSHVQSRPSSPCSTIVLSYLAYSQCHYFRLIISTSKKNGTFHHRARLYQASKQAKQASKQQKEHRRQSAFNLVFIVTLVIDSTRSDEAKSTLVVLARQRCPWSSNDDLFSLFQGQYSSL